ncbi:MAG: hypothetical protein AseanaTS_08410 [Candidatus Pelagadaptatus aseana]|uniref:putative bifunctional diguanylate cyclase/phosphodiesterase n=1 Tax=Candidatus Pelagadaptatus aseana TaxID=3120508 RepID=UPI0039B1A229
MPDTVMDSLASEFIFAQSAQGILITDKDNRITRVNASFERITGYSARDVLGQDPSILGSGMQDDSIYTDMWQSLQSLGSWQGELWNRRKNGKVFIERIAIARRLDSEGQLQGYVGIIEDFSSKKVETEKLRHASNHDSLTDLFNAKYFNLAMDMMVEESRLRQKGFAVILVDVSQFSKINDLYGREFGNRVLKAVADRILNCVREDDVVSRLSSDVFGILIDHIKDMSVLETFLNKLAAALRQKEGASLQFDVRIGAGLFGLAASETDKSTDLLQRVSQSLEYAKKHYHDSYKIYDQGVSDSARLNAVIFNEIGRGLRQGDFSLHYQPIVSPERDIKFEALLRWQHETEGYVSPLDFIPAAEQTGEINLLGMFIVESACQAIKVWRDKCDIDVTVNINLSVVELSRRDVYSHLLEICERYQVSPAQIGIELTESANLLEMVKYMDDFNRLRQVGIKIAVDDFGCGFSSFSYLQKLPIDTVKIDKLFVDDVVTSDRSQKLLAGMIKLIEELGFSVVLEGIETREQLQKLACFKQVSLQGYYYSRPMPFESTFTWIEKNKRGLICE